ncbi:hypothetical protein NQZ68_003867 [Dissostichus eleginoides]|nr:hypothetical protein NQZ68_003867 [Dissostichus eleginoides]
MVTSICYASVAQICIVTNRRLPLRQSAGRLNRSSVWTVELCSQVEISNRGNAFHNCRLNFHEELWKATTPSIISGSSCAGGVQGTLPCLKTAGEVCAAEPVGFLAPDKNNTWPTCCCSCSGLHISENSPENELQDFLHENKHLNLHLFNSSNKTSEYEKVKSEYAQLKETLGAVTQERDLALWERNQLQGKLENLEQVLKHMREAAERRQQLELEHEQALAVLNAKQQEIEVLQKVEAKKEHQGAVHLLENHLDSMQKYSGLLLFLGFTTHSALFHISHQSKLTSGELFESLEHD